MSGALLQFPEGFAWGVATSSYQVEGAVDVDGRGESIWDRFCAREGTIADGSDGAVACGHYDRMPEDVDLMARLGVGTYRFSIAWPRVIPAGTGETNSAGLDFYDRLVDALLTAGIEPMPTLYHWDLPQALDDRGGWLARDTAYAMADYADVVIGRLGDRVKTWTTLNEPFVSANHGYVTGEHAPGHADIRQGLAAAHHLLLAHGLVGSVVRERAPDAELAVVLNFTPATPLTDDPAAIAACAVRSDIENHWYADPIAGRGYPAATAEALGWDRSEVFDGDMDLIAAPIDVLGVNYYTRQLVAAPQPGSRIGDEPATVPPQLPVTSMGWEVHPPSLGWLLRYLDQRYAFPKLMITENGCAMPDTNRIGGRVQDDDRIDYLHRHLKQVHSAIAAGVPVAGYLAWSFLDNFEWARGYDGRFGLVEVDFETLERTPKASALWFSEVMARNGIDDVDEPCHELDGFADYAKN